VELELDVLSVEDDIRGGGGGGGIGGACSTASDTAVSNWLSVIPVPLESRAL
jgi:hypothetical protein